MSGSRHSKYVITELKTPAFTPEFTARYAKYARRVLWIDDKLVPGAFQMTCSWYLKANPDYPVAVHQHDVPEILGFIGSNPDNPPDLGAEIEFWLEDEKFIITKSVMIFVPAGMKHCPLVLHRVDRPVLHFSTVISGQYERR